MTTAHPTRRIATLLAALMMLAGLTAAVSASRSGASDSGAPKADAAAKYNFIVGMGDQRREMFDDPRFRALKIKRVRLQVPWDVIQKGGVELDRVTEWLISARSIDADPLIAFEDFRARKAPSVEEYRTAFALFRKRFPQVREFTTWNEANNGTQPTARKPKRVAQYYAMMRKACPQCTIVAADLLDNSKVKRYAKRFRKAARRLGFPPRIWGLHNYIDANKPRKGGFRKSRTKLFLKGAKGGKVWITETGGLVKYKRGKLRKNQKRAAKALKRIFKIAKKARRVKRVYLYHWKATRFDKKFDSGFIAPNGKERKKYYKALKKLLRKSRV